MGPASPAPESRLLEDPELLVEPEPPLDPELPVAPDDPELLADPELPPELPSADASSELTVLPLLEQPVAESTVHTATSETTARWIDFIAGSSAGTRKTARRPRCPVTKHS